MNNTSNTLPTQKSTPTQFTWDAEDHKFFLDTLVVQDILHQWVLPAVNGTTTPYFIDSDIHDQYFTSLNDDYISVQNFEDSYKEDSRVMYEKWSQGEIYGSDYSSWLSAYLRVWDKLQDTSNDNQISGS